MDFDSYSHPALREEVEERNLVERLCQEKESVVNGGLGEIWKNDYREILFYGLDDNGCPRGGSFLRSISSLWYHVSGLFIADGFRREGRGSFLLETLWGDLDDKQLTLETQTNLLGVRDFYEKNDFEFLEDELLEVYAKGRGKIPVSIDNEIVVWEGNCPVEFRTNVVYGKKHLDEYVF